MVLRITTWNVNGIRNPFGYQPWRDRRTFDGMFDVLEADIVIMQELKIQRKDLTDDMVLVPGWDSFFSLPRQKKGYSGVAIYTRQSKCAPMRAEEGILGVLCPPGSSIPYREQPESNHIGGYLTDEQHKLLELDPVALDAEGRCVVLEFPAFVLLGVYMPANSSGTKTEFRRDFFIAIDMRIRNLVKAGKRVIWTGDLNVSRTTIDTAGATDELRKEGITYEEYISGPSRRIFNQLLEDGEVVGQRDPGREEPVLWDICRGFHPTRSGMYTHWEQKVNARPGNYGSRIDFVLCSLKMKSWFCESDIQEGLHGSDHCPVYAMMNDTVDLEGTATHLVDIMNPPGFFKDGKRLKQYSMKDMPAFSGRLLPEFDRRQTIKSMFAKKPSLLHSTSSTITSNAEDGLSTSISNPPADPQEKITLPSLSPSTQPTSMTTSFESQTTATTSFQMDNSTAPERKRKVSEDSTAPSLKKSKSTVKSASDKRADVTLDKGQKSLKGFFSLASPTKKEVQSSNTISNKGQQGETVNNEEIKDADASNAEKVDKLASLPKQDRTLGNNNTTEPETSASQATTIELTSPEKFIDPIVSKESWTKVFSKPTPPRCEHGEPCKSMKTKKPGFNCGREFWMCQRYVGGFPDDV